ncbi:2-oxoglutarate-dependent ethylene/succinate-forming enzyme [Variovorax sp. PBL-H6]|uniref:isopenicillin N synthase family dioxygenase n=1 Tax=Variovorax sp. PBL-H6 TaxID=434009 RepID=UPI001316048B|nr:isopenicillin N synthase family oxygenase [Variovorax sp. PBL-H6]VTU15205.1 2-oxoglutarate-dependent ethylene/succinate-forming enzyme [Variovorax sp. PBL-H6]
MNAVLNANRNASKVAIIDLTDLRSPDIAGRKRLGEEIARACSEVGFFYIVNHGIAKEKIERMFDIARQFFSLTDEQKQKLSMANNNSYRGYLPMKTTGNDPTMKGLLLEAFHAWQEHAPGDPGVAAGKPLHGVNVWPAQLAGMHEEVMAYAGTVTALARDLLGIAALGIGLPEDTFLRHFDQPLSLLRLIHYPPQEPSETEGRFGTRPHTDNCAFTILAQDDTGGLEIMGEDGEWVGVPPVADSYVINLGEVMKIWTNGMFMATPHRVINRSGKERYSIPFFMNPTHDALVCPILEDAGKGKAEPVFHTTVGIEEGLTSGEILMRLYKRIWPSIDGQQVN